MSAFRTSSGGRIDRARAIRFTFDGREYQGHPGDTLASALIANGVHLLGRSFKYHRPRGLLAAGAEEPNALVTISRGAGHDTPNCRATQVELHEGLAATSQNRWPSLALDIGAANMALSRFLAAGFYYKTFMGPRLGANTAWARFFEPLIRHAAGLGRAPTLPDPDRYAHRYAHCEVLIVGAGHAGIAAALDASSDPACRVVLCDEQGEPGGWLLNESGDWLGEAFATLRARSNVMLLPRTTAFGAYARNFVALSERVTDHLAAPPAGVPRERLWHVRAGEVVLATGAIERPLVFPGNDRPGIMLAGAAEIYARRYGARPGRRAAIFTACDSAYGAAFALHEAGMEIAAIIDLRAEAGAGLAARALARAIPVHPASMVAATRGSNRVKEVEVARLRADGTVSGVDRIGCDCVLMSGGWTPSVHLFSQSRGKLAWDDEIGGFVPGIAASGQNQRSVGAAAGEFSEEMRGGYLGACPVAAESSNAKAFVDFQNDVTVRDLALAVREGFVSVEHAKRYTTAGMATDQGKTANMHALAILARETGRDIPAVGLTTFRQPYTPVTFGLFAGPHRGVHFDPVRRTPMHEQAEAHGGVFEDFGQWRRARHFPRGGEDMHRAVARECRAVREYVGIFDASTLGKIEITGPDAAEFLDRVYATRVGNLAVGRARYALLLNEAGYLIDDGIVARFSPNRFHVTTTTGGAGRVFAMIEDYLQTEWPHLRAWMTSVTEQWAVIAVQGPRARDVLAPLVEGVDLAPGLFPHMAVREGRVAGARARLFRASFTGELGFEVNVPAAHGARAWQAIAAEAEKHRGLVYGTETMHVLRAEKGYVIVGQESDGTMTPDDLGLARLVAAAKPDFIGKRGLLRPDLAAPGRKQLVGLLTEDPRIVLEEGAQITDRADPPAGSSALGHVTSSYMSATLERSIALGVVTNGRARIGEVVHVPMPERAIAARLVEPVFHDAKGERLHG